MKKQHLLLAALGMMMLCAAQVQAAFVVGVDLDPDTTTPLSLHPNFSFGGDTTTASDSIPSDAVGLPEHDSLFGGDGTNFGDTYVVSYTPGVDADNFSPAAGSLLGSNSGFGTETASGVAGGGTGLYNVYFTTPASTNVNAAGSNFRITNSGAQVDVLTVDLNNDGTGPSLDPLHVPGDSSTPPFVGGANNAWYYLATVHLNAGTEYTVTQDANVNSFVSQRLAGVMWEAVPEPSTLLLGCFGGLSLLAGRRRR